MTFTIAGSKSLSVMGLAYGNAGSFTIGKGACLGAVLSIANPRLASLVLLDINGAGSLTTNVPLGACGLTMQGVDLFSCQVTNAIIL